MIDHLTMQPPSAMVRDFVVLMVSPLHEPSDAENITNVGIACAAAVIAGIVFGVALHGRRAIRQVLEPLFATYYAIPVYAFYPLFIILFGLGDAPQILIGFMWPWR